MKKEIPDHPITVSLRVRDKKEEEIEKFVETCIATNIEGILILMGDPSQSKTDDLGLIPSSVVSNLKKKYESKIDLYLSISNNPNFAKIGKKIKANPKGFMTQVIQNIQQVQNLADNLKQFSTNCLYLVKVVPLSIESPPYLSSLNSVCPICFI